MDSQTSYKNVSLKNSGIWWLEFGFCYIWKYNKWQETLKLTHHPSFANGFSLPFDFKSGHNLSEEETAARKRMPKVHQQVVIKLNDLKLAEGKISEEFRVNKVQEILSNGPVPTSGVVLRNMY